MQAALEETHSFPPRTPIDIQEGFTVRRLASGIPLARLHYTVIPDRRNPLWRKTNRKTYSSQAAWDREQEIQDYAGGGELVFADALIGEDKSVNHGFSKIVITDPKWRPESGWTVFGGFDEGQVNPTVFLRAYSDFGGNLYFCGEYYQPGKEIFEHVDALAEMPDIRNISMAWADPSIFPETQRQSSNDGNPQKSKSVNELYCEEGCELLAKFSGDRNDLSFAKRVHNSYWKDPERPKLFIVCRNYADRPQHGLHPWDCPNLLWELLRIRKKKLTATQLMDRNPTEEVVQKDNHAHDACKYIVMSRPDPAERSKDQKLQERLENIPLEDVTSRVIRGKEILEDLEQEEQPIRMSRKVTVRRR
jgi:hypothetical protein